MQFIKYILLISSLAFFFSCKKEQEETIESPAILKNGMLVLNEGLFQLNNSSLTWVDFGAGTSNDQFFTQKSGRLLGDTGNEMLRYGNKIYVVVNVSSTIEVLDAITGNSITQISMQTNGNAKQPRSIRFYGSKAFISCFDGFVDVMDTATFQIEARIPVGLNPDQMTISGQYLFVSNSGGLNAPLMDSTVSVIDLNAKSELIKIVVGKNPGSIVTDHQGDVYVVSRGNYSTIPSRMKKIDQNNFIVLESYNFDASKIAPMNNRLLILNSNKLMLFNADTDELINNNFINNPTISTLSNMYFRSSSQHIYLFDSKGYTNTGNILKYNVNGDFLSQYHVGLNPNSILTYD
jgi:hypothetical protein